MNPSPVEVFNIIELQEIVRNFSFHQLGRELLFAMVQLLDKSLDTKGAFIRFDTIYLKVLSEFFFAFFDVFLGLILIKVSSIERDNKIVESMAAIQNGMYTNTV